MFFGRNNLGYEYAIQPFAKNADVLDLQAAHRQFMRKLGSPHRDIDKFA